MRTTRMLVLTVAVAATVLALASATSANNVGGGGSTLCYDRTQTNHLANTHWVIQTPVGHYDQASVMVKSLNAGETAAHWHLERWGVTPPSTIYKAWTGSTYAMQNSPYATSWYWSPVTATNVYGYYELIVDGSTNFTYSIRTWSSGSC
jgi:hypothetical protein